MEISLLKDIVILFGLANIVVYICHIIRLPAIVGFLFTGVVIGPYGLGLISAKHEVEVLAEIGVVLLLFTIGMEFSFKRLLQIRKSVLLGGSLQVALTFCATAMITLKLSHDMSLNTAVFFGFLVALSSTAIVLKLLQQKAEVGSPHGRTALGILIFQDIIVVPMMLIIPLLAGASANFDQSLIGLLAKGGLIIVVVFASARWVVPNLLYQVTKTRHHELFLLSVVVLCFGVAWLTAEAGLSLALGAFLAGLIISESEYSHHALGNILPFRDVFSTFFFVSIGMMLDVRMMTSHPVIILLITIGVIVFKSTIAGIVTIALEYPIRTAVIVGLTLAQIGEFSFILLKIGYDHHLIDEKIYQVLIAVTVLTMAVTPLITPLAGPLTQILQKLPFPEKLKSGIGPELKSDNELNLTDHLIIIGYGINGKNVAKAAKSANIPFLIIEMNPETVRVEKAKGTPIYYGDATQETIWHHANIDSARVIVVAINDPSATRKITEVIRRLNSTVYVIVRTPYLLEMKPLYELGATEVIPEEFETSIEIFARVLATYYVPRKKIEQLIAKVRADGYEMFRVLSDKQTDIYDLRRHMPNMEIQAFEVEPGCPAEGKTLMGMEFRKKFQMNVMAVQRGPNAMADMDGEFVMESGDIVFLFGPIEKMPEVEWLFHGEQTESESKSGPESSITEP